MKTIEDHLIQYGIAIIGMAGRFPGANTPEEFWDNLAQGVESIRFFSEEELKASGVPEHLRKHPDYVPAKGALDDIAGFDADFFNIPPKEAELIDPQQRHFLECAWEVLERAGYDPESYAERIGVFASASKNTYLLVNLVTHPELQEHSQAIQALIANDKDYISMRTSYKLNLRGPSLTIQTACSSSLVSLHMACQSLITGECEMAIAGASAIDVPHKAGYLYQPGGLFSPDGHCRAFDDNARGTVFGQGVGVVLLKPLEQALKDKDYIHAVIRSSAINNDGANKTGFTAPSVQGQAEAISEAIALADIDAASISYVEAHGTGTALGDPIEVEALKLAFAQHTEAKNFCALGSVKTNIGHLNAASGMAGLIKTVLSLENGSIPPTLHFNRPNRHIDFDNSPFYVSRGATFKEGSKRRAGVSSFGIGGTNAHVILEEAPECEPRATVEKKELIVLSARSLKALEAAKKRLGNYLKKHQPNLSNVAFTLATARRAFAYRAFFICENTAEALGILLSDKSASIQSAVVQTTKAEGKAPCAKSNEDRSACLQQWGEQWLQGQALNWLELFDKKQHQRIPLPTYPFEHKRHWIERREPWIPEKEARTVVTTDVEARILAIFKKLLGVETVKTTDNFFDLGGDSLLGIDLIAYVKDEFELSVPLNALFAAPTVAEIVQLIETAKDLGVKAAVQGMTNEAASDKHLDESIQPPTAFDFDSKPPALLVTGATGFLGTFIIEELLAKTEANIYCLVRAGSLEEGFARLEKGFRYYGLNGFAKKERLRVLLGDLSEVHFGLPEAEYMALAEEISAIYHCGAKLSFIDPYRNLRKINVQGTRTAIEFACTKRTKHLHHVSSIAVYDSDNYVGLPHADESLSLEESRGFHTGYDESKWVSEMLVAEAGRRGVPVTVYRPGNISGDARTGICSATDLVGIMIRGCIELGFAPDNDAFVDVVPIDYVARSLVHLSLQEFAVGEKYNLVNTKPARWIQFVHMIQKLGYGIRTEPFESWCERLRAEARKANSSNPLVPLLPTFDERPLFSNRCYSGKKVLETLVSTDIRCHAMDEGLFNLYINHLVEKGALMPLVEQEM
jgi:thioester reductase-like protein